MRCDAMRRVCMSGNGHGAIRFTKEEETKWLAWRNNRLVRFGGLAHQFLQTLFQTGLPGVRRRQRLPRLVIRLHCVSRKELQHWRRNSWKRPAYMPSCHALVGTQETDSTHAHHSSDQLTRTASLYFGRLDELTTSISHGPQATSHEFSGERRLALVLVP